MKKKTEALLIDSIPDALAWNNNKGGVNLNSTRSNQMVLYVCAFQTACKGDIIRNKKCVKRANGTDAYSKGTDAYSKGTDAYSKGTDAYSKGTAILLSSKEIPNADFEVTCKKCNTTRKVDSIMER
jgi:hypothetical protein